MEIWIVDDVNKQMNMNTKGIIDGTLPPGRYIYMEPETFSKIFTPQKIRIILKLMKGDVESLSDLARKLGRKFEAVHRDVKDLEGRDLIKVVRKQNKCIPMLNGPISMKAKV